MIVLMMSVLTAVTLFLIGAGVYTMSTTGAFLILCGLLTLLLLIMLACDAHEEGK